MTCFISFRSAAVGGSILNRPLVLSGDGTKTPLGLQPMTEDALAARIAGRDLLFAVHGFNVGLVSGASQMTRIEQKLALPASALFLGVLWPGDFVIPVINYPFEGSVAVTCGRRLADFCNRLLGHAASLSFFSHSLGGRLALEAIAGLNRKARTACLAAAAVDRDVLTSQYSRAFLNAERVTVLSSRKDTVLQIAYPAGDFLSDLFGDGDSPFRSALGLKGPYPFPTPAAGNYHVPIDPPCRHGDYMPDGHYFEPVAAFTRRCFDGAAQIWPPS